MPESQLPGVGRNVEGCRDHLIIGGNSYLKRHRGEGTHLGTYLGDPPEIDTHKIN